MPLLPGKKNFGKNVSELENKFKKTGKIGTSHPANKEKAEKQAEAIAYSEEGKGKTIKESSIPNFISAMTQKNYASANKYLKQAVMEKVKTKINKASAVKPF